MRVLILLCLTATASLLSAQDTLRQPWSIGLALSGGAALGLAHVGVIEVLEEEGVPISCVSGTSMGSIVGGMYAAGYSGAQMDSILTTVDWSSLFSNRIPENRMTLARREEGKRNIVEVTHRWFVPYMPSGVVSLQNVEILLTDLLAEAEFDAGYDFDSLVVPFRCVATDVVTGERIIFTRGSMVDAIRSSIAIPAVFSPAEIGKNFYIDGGAVMNLPVEPLLEFKPDYIIASDVIRWTPEARNIIDVVTRTMAIVTEENRRQQRKLASVVIYPNVDSFLPSSFSRAPELVRTGEISARAAVPAIKEKLEDHPLVLKRRELAPRPRPLVSDVRIEDLKVTRESFVRREIETKPGDTLDFKAIVRDLERLRATGLFRHISHELSFHDSKVDVVYTVVEKDYGIYGLAASYDNVYGFALRLEVSQGNLFGSGAILGFSTTMGEPTDMRIGLRGARLMALPFTYRLEGFRCRTEHFFYDNRVKMFDYHTWTTGVDAEFGYALGRWGYFTLGYSHRRYLHDLPAFADTTGTRELVTGPAARFRVSSLDDLNFPSKGFDFSLASKAGLPNRITPQAFLKLETEGEGYFPFGNRLTLGLALGYGLGIDSLPRAEMFHLGGIELSGAEEDFFSVREYIRTRVTLAFRLTNLLHNERYPLRIELRTDIALLDPIFAGPFDFSTTENTFMGFALGAAANTPAGPLSAFVGLSSDRKVTWRVQIGIPLRDRMQVQN